MDITGEAARGTASVPPQLLDDQLAVLRRAWLAVAQEVAPDASQLVGLLNGRLDQFGNGRAPTEYDLLTVAEDAAQAALQATSADNARVLSKRLRRAVYEFLLAVDAAAARIAAYGDAAFDGPTGVVGLSHRRNGLGSLMIGLEEVAGHPPGESEDALRARPELIWDAADVGVPLAAPQRMVTDAPRLLARLGHERADLERGDAAVAAARRPPEDHRIDGGVDAPEPPPAVHWGNGVHASVPPMDNLLPWPQALREVLGDAPRDDGIEVGDPPPPITPVDQQAEPETAGEATDVGPSPEATDVEPSPEATPDVEPSAEATDVEPSAEATEVEPSPEATDVEPTAEATDVEPTAEATDVEPSAEAERVPPTFRREPERASTPLVIPSYRAWADVIAAAVNAGDDEPADYAPASTVGAPLPGPDLGVRSGPAPDALDAAVSHPAAVYPVPAENPGPAWLLQNLDDNPWAQPPAALDPGSAPVGDEVLPSPVPAATRAPDPVEAPEPEALVPWDIATPPAAAGWLAPAAGWRPAEAPDRGVSEAPDATGAGWPETSGPTPPPAVGWPAGTLVPPATLAAKPLATGWSVRTSPRKRLISERLAERRREEVVRAAVEATDPENARRRKRDRDATPLMLEALPLQIDELVRRRKGADAGSLLQRAAQEIGGRQVADLALDAGDRVRALGQMRPAIGCYLAAWRADPINELPLWRLADTCLVDRSVDLAVGYLERIAALMRARGDDEGAIDVYRKIMTVAPDRHNVRDILRHAQATGHLPD